jgi:hypothetical protein
LRSIPASSELWHLPIEGRSDVTLGTFALIARTGR